MRPLSSGSGLRGCAFPDAESDFRSIRRSGQFFVDKTHLIWTLKKRGRKMVLARPPGWGKSLLQSMLAVYHDRNTPADEFHELFGDLDIGKWPTSEAQSFYVLPINLNVENCEPDARYQHLFAQISASVDDFAARYDLPDIRQYPDNASMSIRSICHAVKRRQGRLIVLVDDYDSLVNEVILDGPDASRDEASIDKATSLVDELLGALKAGSPARALITGVNNLFVCEWNGASIFEYITFDEPLASIVGFTERDVRRGLAELRLSQASADSAVELLRACYGDYRYPGVPEEQPLFNAQQCLHLFRRAASGVTRPLLENSAWKACPLSDLIDAVVDP